MSAGEGQDGPFTQKLTLTNTGDEPVTWSLSHIDAVSSGIDPADDEAWQNDPDLFSEESRVSFSTSTVTVPAGGTAKVDVTIAPPTGRGRAPPTAASWCSSPGGHHPDGSVRRHVRRLRQPEALPGPGHGPAHGRRGRRLRRLAGPAVRRPGRRARLPRREQDLHRQRRQPLGGGAHGLPGPLAHHGGAEGRRQGQADRGERRAGLPDGLQGSFGRARHLLVGRQGAGHLRPDGRRRPGPLRAASHGGGGRRRRGHAVVDL
ncbi:hypothetical protein G7085_08070 [Tessaracoccus sp. HDW20]|nr:hypothetical protein [Tessaracoccus coleopterorum]